MTSRAAADLRYSVRLAEPFREFLPDEVAAPAQPAATPRSTERRVGIVAAHQSLLEAVERTGDPTLGLKAACNRSPGDAGAIEYAMHSAATLSNALDVAARYIRLLNDALEIRIDCQGERAWMRMESRVELPLVAEDFMVAVFYRVHLHRLLDDCSEVECWLQHDAPPDVSAYDRTFAPAKVRFQAPSSGFALPTNMLSVPLPNADAKLHRLLLEHMEQNLADLPFTRSVTDQVRQVISDQLPRERATAASVAKRLRMSERTLARRLEGEGTSFGRVLDDIRRKRAIGYLDDGRLSIQEVSFLLGFSQPTAFYRAFKRWTGTTPQHYRPGSSPR